MKKIFKRILLPIIEFLSSISTTSFERNCGHIFYCLLAISSVISCGWNFSNPKLVLPILTLLPIFGATAYIPNKYFPSIIRNTIALIVAVTGFTYFIIKSQSNLPLDKSLVETLMILTLSLTIAGTRKNLNYLLIVSTILQIYGALIPRTSFLYSFSGYLFLMVLIFISSRSDNLIGINLKKHHPFTALKKSWATTIFYCLLSFVFFMVIFPLFPLETGDHYGIFSVSFTHDNHLLVKDDTLSWLRRSGPFERSSNSIKEINAKDNFDVLKNSGPIVDAPKKDAPKVPSLDGSGSTPPGEKLIFTVKSKVKLYHMAAIYDNYDGEKWITSNAVKNTRIKSKNTYLSYPSVESTYTLYEYFSNKIYIPYRPNGLEMIKLPTKYSTREFIPHFIPKSLPALPLSYITRTYLEIPLTPDKRLENLPPLTPLWDRIKTVKKIPPKKVIPRKVIAKKQPKKTVPKKVITSKNNSKNPKVAKKNTATKNSKNKVASKTATKKAAPKAKVAPKAAPKKVVAKKPIPKKVVPKAKVAPKKVVAKKPIPKKVVPKKNNKKVIAKRPYKPNYRYLNWKETASPGYFTQLPTKKISTRLLDKVKELTINHKSDLAKATALRDYLRNNFTYAQFSSSIPKGKEGADYFIFELKTGHCEYFAQTLAVMARITGMPARVVTGFSPGNFNTLTGLFEVHEYHAHAWTQIYIPQYGWLTFDATPPSNLRLKTLPAAIGQFRDPFGDEWQVLVPELTEHNLKVLNEQIAKIEKAKVPSTHNKTQAALTKVAEKKEEIQEKISKIYNDAENKKAIDKIKNTNYFAYFSGKIKEFLSSIAFSLKSNLPPFNLLFIPIVILIFIKPIIQLLYKIKCFILVVPTLLKIKKAIKNENYQLAVILCYKVACLSLAVKNIKIQPQETALEYSTRLASLVPTLKKLAKSYYLAKYSEQKISLYTAKTAQTIAVKIIFSKIKKK
jgi:hypothetical protein